MTEEKIVALTELIFVSQKFRSNGHNFFLPTKRTHSFHSFVVGTLLRRNALKNNRYILIAVKFYKI